MPSPLTKQDQGHRRLSTTGMPKQSHPGEKPNAKYMPGTEFSSPGKICPFRDHNESPAASGDSHIQTWTKGIKSRRQAPRNDGEAEAEKGTRGGVKETEVWAAWTKGVVTVLVILMASWISLFKDEKNCVDV